MTVQKSYLKPSITEALIDLRVRFSSEIEPSVIATLKNSLKEDYPDQKSVYEVEAEIQSVSGIQPTTTTNQSLVGYNFSSIDIKQVLQARTDRFTFSRLSPYESWESFRDEAKRLWNLYQTVTQPISIERVAVRYINRIDIPIQSQDSLDLKEYLRTLPEISSDLPQGLSGYFMQLEIPQDDIEGILMLQQAIIPTLKENQVSIVLDTDLFCNVDFCSNENKHWELLEKLRTRKNMIFEACITDKTRRLFE